MGRSVFSIAAQTYFGIDASQLNWQQAALLAGMVQSPTSLGPLHQPPYGALQRRNIVLDTMIENLPQQADQLRAAKAEPLGVLPQPNKLPGGCIAADENGFFCDYVLEYLARAGVSKEQVARGGYLIRTTLEPKVQGSVKSAIDKIASPTLDGVASVMSVIKPGKDRIASWRWPATGRMASTATPTRQCSSSRSRSWVMGRARSSRYSPRQRRSTWAWVSTLSCRCRAHSRLGALAAAIRQAVRRKLGA